MSKEEEGTSSDDDDDYVVKTYLVLVTDAKCLLKRLQRDKNSYFNHVPSKVSDEFLKKFSITNYDTSNIVPDEVIDKILGYLDTTTYIEEIVYDFDDTDDCYLDCWDCVAHEIPEIKKPITVADKDMIQGLIALGYTKICCVRGEPYESCNIKLERFLKIEEPHIFRDAWSGSCTIIDKKNLEYRQAIAMWS